MVYHSHVRCQYEGQVGEGYPELYVPPFPLSYKYKIIPKLKLYFKRSVLLTQTSREMLIQVVFCPHSSSLKSHNLDTKRSLYLPWTLGRWGWGVSLASRAAGVGETAHVHST